jgi:uncharacterized protein YbaR (Trm112 family)
VTLSPELLDLLVCPKSKAPLEYHPGPPEVLVCRTSKLVYPVQDGIPIMLIDEAQPLDEAAYPSLPAPSPSAPSTSA